MLVSAFPFLLGVLGCALKASPLDALLAARGDAESALVFRSRSPHMDDFMAGFGGELDGELTVQTFEMTERTRAAQMAAAITALSPSVVVLVDNPTVALYREARAAVPELPPALVVMSLFLEEQIDGMDEATGVFYEIPGVTTFRSLRQLLEGPVQKVGVVYRPQFGRFIEKQTTLAQIERFELVSVEVSAAPSPRELKAALTSLRDEHQVDALWILNDNGLLGPELLVSGWLPGLEGGALPVMVGVASLLELSVPFGHFAVLPDHEEMGMQAAQMVYALWDEGWDAEAISPELPIAVETALRVDLLAEHFSLRDDAVADVDRVVDAPDPR